MSPAIQKLAKKRYRLFLIDPSNEDLVFKKVNKSNDYWSVRIDDNYRAIGVRDGNTMHWFFIGNHREYDRFLANA